jgi:hypothetical protein
MPGRAEQSDKAEAGKDAGDIQAPRKKKGRLAAALIHREILTDQKL